MPHPGSFWHLQLSVCTVGTAKVKERSLSSPQSLWPMHRASFPKCKRRSLHLALKGVLTVPLHSPLFGHRHYWAYSIDGKYVPGSWCCSSVPVPCTRVSKGRDYQLQRHLLTSPHTHTACLHWQWQIVHLNREPISASSREGSTQLINLPHCRVGTLTYSLTNISKCCVLTYAHRLGMSDSMSFQGSWCFNEGFASSSSEGSTVCSAAHHL